MEPGPRSGSRAKLSCVRCKYKKIRCDKADPKCDKCSISGVECTYAQRRQRTRKPQHRDAVGRLSQQLEHLESHISTLVEPTSSWPSAESSGTPASRGDRVDLNSNTSTKDKAPNQDSETSDRESGAFYRMVNDARNTTISKLCDKELLAVEASPNVDSALAALNGALAALGDLRVSPHAAPELDPKEVLTREEKRLCLDDAFELLSTIVPCPPIDMNMVKAMPDIVDSPHIRVDPAANLLYHGLLFEGRSLGPKTSAASAKHDYIKCLQLVPAWHECATGTVLDMMVAIGTAMVAITCFDYHLGWKFHREACRFAEQLGIDGTDMPSPRASADGPDAPDLRGAFWCVVQMDLLFKLFYGKPAVLKPSTSRRIVTSAFFPVSSRVKPAPTIMLILWTRMFFVLIEFFDYIENHDVEGSKRPEDFVQQIDSFCDQIEELINDWPFEVFKGGHQDPMVKWLHADLAVGAHTTIILMQRKVFSDGQIPVSPRSLRSGRTVLKTIVEVSDSDPGKSHHMLTFYPFCAFFALYYHILSCSNPEDCKEDIQILEEVGRVLESVKSLRSEIIPISNAVNALNHITKAIQENRIASAATKTTQPMPSIIPSTEYPPTQQNYPLGFDAMSGVDIPQINFLDSTLDLPVDLGEGFQPMEYTRAVENELVGRNWHENWWSIS